jgi:hypothetical protein
MHVATCSGRLQSYKLALMHMLVLWPFFLNFIEMDITRVTDWFCDVLGQALGSNEGDSHYHLTEEKYAKCLIEVKTANIL